MQTNLYLSEEEQRILAHARVGIAGAGGLGSNCAAALVRAGVEKLVICDYDMVQLSNLNRQFYFRHQIGMKKVAALGENLQMINPTVDLRLYDIRLDEGNIAGIFANCDVVVEAFDTVESKKMFFAALACEKYPLVGASGMAGWGRSNTMTLRKIGKRIYMAGDGTSGIDATNHPQSARVAIASAIEANTVLALLLGKEV